MKRLLFLMLVLVQPALHAQSNLFHENFNTPSGADSVTATSGGSYPSIWVLSNGYQPSGGQAYRAEPQKPMRSYSVYTDTFSTPWNEYIHLSFRHASLLHEANRFYIEVSDDYGQSWQRVTAESYLGKSKGFKQNDYFNVESYPDWSTSALDSNMWRTERFNLDGLANDTNYGGRSVNGRTGVVIRFVLEFNSQGPALFNKQFLDEITVTGSSCDTDPPAITINSNNILCRSVPQGFTANSSNTVTVEIEDRISLQSKEISQRINGGNFSTSALTVAPGPHLYQSTLNMNPGDTLDYYIEAKDNCGNASRIPDTGFFRLVYSSQIESRCTTPNCSGLSAIGPLPYKQSFEGIGWNPVKNTDKAQLSRNAFPLNYSIYNALSNYLGWVLNTGPTHSNSGPTSASDGTNYLYLENTGALGPNKWSSFQLPCVMLSATQTTVLEFDYHMFGEDIDGLWVDIDTGTGSAAWYNIYHSIMGEQQISARSAWKKASIFLDDFKGEIIRVRFRGRAADKALNHVAIDNIEIKEVVSNDLALRKGDLRMAKQTCRGDSLLPEFEIVNYGDQALSNVSLSFDQPDGSTVNETIAGPIPAHAVFSYTASQKLHLPAQQWTATFSITHPGDTITSNNSVDVVVEAKAPNSISFPVLFNPDAKGAFRTAADSSFFVPANGLSWEALGPDDYNNLIQPPLQATDSRLVLKNSNASPLVPHVLESGCFNVGPNTVFSYYSNMVKDATIKVEILINEISYELNSRQFSATATSSGGLAERHLNLSAYDGATARLRLTVKDPSGSTYIRNLRLTNGGLDVALVEIAPVAFTMYKDSLDINSALLKTDITGAGPFNCQMQMMVIDSCGNGGTYLSNTKSFNAPYPSVDGLAFSTPIPEGLHAVKLWCDCPGDNIPENDTLYSSMIVTDIHSLPYFNDFESCAVDFRGSNNGYQQWELGQDTAAAKPNRVFMTNKDTVNISPSQERLVFPVLDFGNYKDVSIAFKANMDFGKAGQSFSIEILTALGWKRINVKAGNLPSGSTNGWEKFEIVLSDKQYQPGRNILRFVAQKGDMMIDSVKVYYPPQLSVAPEIARFNKGIPVRDSLHHIKVDVVNTGARAVSSFQLALYDRSGQMLHSQQVNHAIAPSRQTTVGFNLAIPVTSKSEFLLVSSLPNGTADELPTDDTLKLEIYPLPQTLSNNSCFNFESDHALAPYNSDGYADTLWTWGEPSKTMTASGHNSTKAWYTDGDYSNLEDSYLYSSLMEVKPTQCYKLSFYHQVDTELNYDGGNVEISLDSGRTWEVLGGADSLWYNSDHIHALDIAKPGFSGHTSGWQYAETTFNSFDQTQVQLRFRFASDYGGTGEGWVIDDLCIEEIAGNCQQVTEEELEADSFQLYPNPASQQVQLSLPDGDSYQLMISDQQGRPLRQIEVSNTKVMVLDIQDLPAGIYAISLKNDQGFVSHRKLIVE